MTKTQRFMTGTWSFFFFFLTSHQMVYFINCFKVHVFLCVEVVGSRKIKILFGWQNINLKESRIGSLMYHLFMPKVRSASWKVFVLQTRYRWRDAEIKNEPKLTDKSSAWVNLTQEFELNMFMCQRLCCFLYWYLLCKKCSKLPEIHHTKIKK